MALYDSPEHRVTTYSLASGRDAGGGNTAAYTAVDSAVPCTINTASASTVEKYAQDQIQVSHTVSFLLAALATPLTRGMKLVAADSSASFHVEGIRTGRAQGSIPALLYADCREILG